MAKKFGKFLLGAAILGGAAAAAYYYLQKKDTVTLPQEESDADYDDFSEEKEETPCRNYVQLNPEVAADTAEECGCDTAEGTCDAASTECQCDTPEPACECGNEEEVFTDTTEETIAEEASAPEKVEEFFAE